MATPEIGSKDNRFNTEYYVEGYAFDYEPYVLFEYDGVKVYEQIDRNALVGADLSDVIMQYDHEGRVLARVTNDTLVLEADDRGLFVLADLGLTDASRQLYEDIDKGLVNKMSWAFVVDEEYYDKETRTRHIMKIKKVYDVSAVSIPANDDTTIHARQAKDIYEDIVALEERERQKQKLRIKLKLIEGGM